MATQPERLTAVKPNARPSRLLLAVIIWLPIIVWALAFPFIKIGLRELSPVNLTIARLFLVCGIFLCFIPAAPRRFSPLRRADIVPLFLLGFFGVVVYHLGLNYGETLMSASAASLIIATIPVFMVILAALFLKERITARIAGGIVLSGLGVVVIAVVGTPGDPFEISYVSAAAAVLLAAIFGAAYTVAGKKLLERYNALSLTVYAMVFGCLGLLPFVALSPSLLPELFSLSLGGWGAVIFLAVFPTVVGYTLWYVALELKPASELGAYLYVIPVLSTVASYLFFGETVTWLFLLGGALVVLGLILLNTKGRRVESLK